jgi:hypothetical protein
MFDRIIARILRVVRLDASVYQEIRDDPQATREAAIVVVGAALLSALGSLSITRDLFARMGTQFLLGVLVQWLLWSVVAFLVGTAIYHSSARFVSVLRVLGYATAPLAVGILSIFGCLGALFALLAWAFSLYLGFYAVREAMGLRTEAAMVTIASASVAVLVIGVLARFLM